MTQFTERQLVALVQESLPYNTQFFQQLVTPYLPQLKAYSVKVLGNISDAEDVVQETIIKAMTNMKGFKWIVSFKVWLFKIAHNECINKIRERRWEHIDNGDDYLDSLEADMPSENDIAKMMMLLVEELSFVDRNIVLLRYRTGLEFQEIADICEMKLSAVKMRHKRVIDHLQTQVARHK